MSTAQQHEMSAAGTHLIADFWGVEPIDSVAALEAVVRDAVAIADATLLDLRFHKFPGHGGITGYAMLAESHISVHTWPERDYVAIDVFMCGGQRPDDSLEVLRRAFRPASEEIRSVARGVAPEATPSEGRSPDDSAPATRPTAASPDTAPATAARPSVDRSAALPPGTIASPSDAGTLPSGTNVDRSDTNRPPAASAVRSSVTPWPSTSAGGA